MEYETYLNGLTHRLNYLISLIDSCELSELENIEQEIKVIKMLRKTANDEMYSSDEVQS